MDAYLGVDLSAGKWAGFLLADRLDACFVADDIASLVDLATAVQRPRTIAIDIPFAPPDQGVRRADQAARGILRSRGSTLFNTPSAAALDVARAFGYSAAGYPAALEANLAVQGIGLSRQAYSLARWIHDVGDWVASEGAKGFDVIECHPEVSFAHLVNPRSPTPIRFGKRSWEGMRTRMRLLHGAGIDVQYVRDETGLIGVDDLLDAAAAAWTARRYAGGAAHRYPADEPEESEAPIWA